MLLVSASQKSGEGFSSQNWDSRPLHTTWLQTAHFLTHFGCSLFHLWFSLPLSSHCLSDLDPHLVLTSVSWPWISQLVSDPVDFHKFPDISPNSAYLSNFSSPSPLIHCSFNPNIYSVLPMFQPPCRGLESRIWKRHCPALEVYGKHILVYRLWLDWKNKMPWDREFIQNEW